jgi:hypothetical protein
VDRYEAVVETNVTFHAPGERLTRTHFPAVLQHDDVPDKPASEKTLHVTR